MSQINVGLKVEVDGKEITSQKLGHTKFEIWGKIKNKVFKIPFKSYTREFLDVLRGYFFGREYQQATAMTQDAVTRDTTVTLPDTTMYEVGGKAKLKPASTEVGTALSAYEITNSNALADLWTKLVYATIDHNTITSTQDEALIYEDAGLVGITTGVANLVISGSMTVKAIKLVIGSTYSNGVTLDDELDISTEITGTFKDLNINFLLPVTHSVIGIKIYGIGTVTITKFELAEVAATVSAIELLGQELTVIDKTDTTIVLSTTEKVTISTDFPEFMSVADTGFYKINGYEDALYGILIGKIDVNSSLKNMRILWEDIKDNPSLYDTNDMMYGDTTVDNMPRFIANTYTHSMGFERDITSLGDTNLILNLFLVAKNDAGKSILYSWDNIDNVALTMNTNDVLRIRKEITATSSADMGGITHNLFRFIVAGMLKGTPKLTANHTLLNVYNQTISNAGLSTLACNATEDVKTYGILLGANLTTKTDLTKKAMYCINFDTLLKYTTTQAGFKVGDMEIREIDISNEVASFDMIRIFTCTATSGMEIGTAMLLSNDGSNIIPLIVNFINGANSPILIEKGQNVRVTYTFSISHTPDDALTAL